MNKQDLKTWINKNARGYENRKSGKEIERATGIDFRIVSEVLFYDMEVINVNGGYFEVTDNDVKIIQRKQIRIIENYKRLNYQKKKLENMLSDFDS